MRREDWQEEEGEEKRSWKSLDPTGKARCQRTCEVELPAGYQVRPHRHPEPWADQREGALLGVAEESIAEVRKIAWGWLRTDCEVE